MLRAFSLAELHLMRLPCCSISQYNGISKGVSYRVCVELEAYQAVIYNKKDDAVTARQHGRLIVEKLNVGHY